MIHDLHRLVGFRKLHNWKSIELVAQPNITILKGNEIPLELGAVTTILKSRRNTESVPHPPNYLSITHIDIGYSPTVAIGDNKYTVLFIDHAIRKNFLYGLSSLTNKLIRQVFE